ncbi:MAG TPA: AAA family ATPase [Myxococcota bacterium]|nr:AAA family ATPase [Myxococcota bacterium]
MRPALGTSEFSILRASSALYVDKTAWVAKVLEDDARVLLLTRPRRFGKSLFLSTVRAFVERSELSGVDSTAAFAGLDVWRSVTARAHHQRHPVVHLSFKGMNSATWEGMREQMALMLSTMLDPFFRRWSSSELDPHGVLVAVWERRATDAQLVASLGALTRELHRLTGEPVVVLIDEYDAPLHAAWERGFLDPAIHLYRGLLEAVLKDNPALYRGVLTGVLRVARESLFSGLNHVVVRSVLDHDFCAACGFTEDEVATLLAEAGLADRLGEVRAWYNGYRFGDATIYNPWSILSFLATPANGTLPYWSNTGGTGLIERLLRVAPPETSRLFEDLLAGHTITRRVDEQLILRGLERREGALWSLLIAAGYLKVVRQQLGGDGLIADLAIPNLDVGTTWRGLFADWLEEHAGAQDAVRALGQAVLRGDAPVFQELLQDIVTASWSAHLTDRRQPERVWQAFVLGLLVHLSGDWEVRSELESGFGRADVVVRPRRPGLPGAVLELKRQEEGEDPGAALDAALTQIAQRDYAAALRQAGASVVQEIGVVFEGRRVWVKVRRG